MSKKKQKTYKTKHSIIKEITIGEQFVTEGGEIIEFIELDSSASNTEFCFIFKPISNHKKYFKYSYTIELGYWLLYGNDERDIKEKYIPMKDKLNVI
jgi:hypothetical protein